MNASYAGTLLSHYTGHIDYHYDMPWSKLCVSKVLLSLYDCNCSLDRSVIVRNGPLIALWLARCISSFPLSAHC